MNHKKNTISSKKMAVVFFVLSVLIMVVSYAIAQSMVKRIELENFTTEIRNDTKKNVSAAKNLLDGMVVELEHTAAAIEEYDDLWDPEVKRILEFSHRMNMFDVTFVADTNGNAYADNGYEFSVGDEKFFQKAMGGNVVFSEIMPSKRYKAIQIISHPLYTEEHEIKGILFGLFNVETFSRLINNAIDYKEHIYVVDANGTYINCFDEHHKISNQTNFWADLALREFHGTTAEEIKSDFQQNKEGEFSYSYEGVQRYGCHMPLGIQNWQIVLTVEETTMSAHIKSIQVVDAIDTSISIVCLTIMLLCVYAYFKSTNNEIQKVNQKISKNNEMMRMAVEFSDYIIFEYDREEQRIELKTAIENSLFDKKVIAPAPECFLNKNIVAENSIDALKKLFETIETEKSCQADIQINDNQQEKIWYRVAMHNVYNAQGKIVGTVGSAEDITLLKKGELAIKRKEETRRTLIKNALLYARVNLDADTVMEINGEEVQMSYQDCLHKKIAENVSEEHQSYVAQKLSLKSLKETYEKEGESTEVQCIMKNGQEGKWISCFVYRIYMSEIPEVSIIVLDIDEKKRKAIALKTRAERDGLTGLYNSETARIKMKDVLYSKHSSGENQILILLDLDNFKKINDTFGHVYGDQVLVDMADVLNKRFRSNDIVGRVGGDEFAILLCNVKSNYLVNNLVKSLIESLTKTYEKEGVSITVSASLGVAISPKDGTVFEELYRKADAALYQMKKERKQLNRDM